MSDNSGTTPTTIQWDFGTAYDFFASLEVLHAPSDFGLRPAWAAGVRSRLGSEEREFLEDVVSVVVVPLGWVYGLPAPKDTPTALYALKQIPVEDRISTIMASPYGKSDYYDRLMEVKERRKWDEDDKEFILSIYNKKKSKKGKPEFGFHPGAAEVEKLLNFFAKPEEFGTKYLNALQQYYDVFFAEEEKRIEKKQKEALARAQGLAEELTPVELLSEISRGRRYEELPEHRELILVPSYWFSPLMIHGYASKEQMLMLFGARSQGESLVPGEVVPEDLVRALKAMADPTRLRILRYLIQEQLTPAELSRRLRLRAPTVTHHLHALQLAGLVRKVVRGKTERVYFARMDLVKTNFAMLKDFLEEDVLEVEGVDVIDRGRVY